MSETVTYVATFRSEVLPPSLEHSAMASFHSSPESSDFSDVLVRLKPFQIIRLYKTPTSQGIQSLSTIQAKWFIMFREIQRSIIAAGIT